MNEVGKVTTIIKDHVKALAIGESSEGLFNTPGVFLFGLTLPRKDRDASRSNAVNIDRID